AHSPPSPVRCGCPPIPHPARMRKLLASLLLALTLASPAFAQTLLSNLPPNTVVGRTGISTGPAQAIPFSILTGGLLQAMTGDLTCSIAGFGTTPPAAVTGAKIAAGTVANSNLASMAAGTHKCRTVSNGTGAPQDCSWPVVNVMDAPFGAVGDGSTDDT